MSSLSPAQQEPALATSASWHPYVHAFAAKLGSTRELVAWFSDHRKELLAQLSVHGAILFRGSGFCESEQLELVARALGVTFQSYAGGNTPRGKLASHVYSSTEFVASQRIALHNELSYHHTFPEVLLFACETAAAEGGATPLARGSEILRRIPAAIVDDFRRKQLVYIRNLHSGIGLGRSWQSTFEATSRAEVEAHLRGEGLRHSFEADGTLRIWQRRPATLLHRRTGREVWFNQADEFHPSSLGAEDMAQLIELHDGDVHKLPMYVEFADGSEIPGAYLDAIRAAIDLETTRFEWRVGDVLLVDNLAVAHGRDPFRGARKIAVTMGSLS